jgi:hypothetical protein
MECKHCGRTHRTEEALAKCATRQERKAERETKKKKEIERRVANAKAEPPDLYIKRMRQEEKNLSQIVGGLRKNYLPPTVDSEWDLYEVAYRVGETLNWGWIDNETKALMLLEKHMCGDFIVHPLQVLEIQDPRTSIAAITGDRRVELDDGDSYSVA